MFYWSEQAELQILCAAGGREGKTSCRFCNRSSVAKENPVQGGRSAQIIHRYPGCPSVFSELLCPATAGKGDCGRNLSSFLDPGTCVTCAFCGRPGFCVNSFSPITMKYIRKCMFEKSECNQTWFNIDHPKEHFIPHQPLPFCILFPVQAVFSGKSDVGVGVRAEGESCNAEGVGAQVMRKKKHHLHARAGGFP